MPGEPALVEFIHERIRVVLFHIEDAGARPFTGEDHFSTDHGRDARGVRDSLRADLFEALFVIADIVNVNGFIFAVLYAGDDVADAGFALGGFAKVARVGEHGLQELERDDFHAVVNNRINTSHANVLEDFEMLEVIRREGHPELSPADGRDVFDQAFHFFMIHTVDFICANFLRAGEASVHAHGGRFLECALFPMAARGRYLTDVDFRVEVGGESHAMIAAVDINDVQCMDFVEMVLESPSGEDIGNAGVKAGPQKSEEASLTEFFLVCPLPGVFELGDIARFIVGGVHIVDSGFQTGVHQGEILIWKSHIDQ